jgi:glycosyltransferase involved in cell wall biosynthesis
MHCRYSEGGCPDNGGSVARDLELAHCDCAAAFTGSCMRIAQVAPLAESVFPKLYGGTERVIGWLTEDLIALGHEVTVFASGDSATPATLVPAWPRALRLGRPKADPAVAETALLELIGQYAQRFDVIHCQPTGPICRC